MKYTYVLNLKGTSTRPRLKPMLKYPRTDYNAPIPKWFIKYEAEHEMTGWINLGNLDVECDFELHFHNKAQPFKYHELHKIIHGKEYESKPD